MMEIDQLTKELRVESDLDDTSTPSNENNEELSSATPEVVDDSMPEAVEKLAIDSTDDAETFISTEDNAENDDDKDERYLISR